MANIIITLLIVFYRIPFIRIIGDTGMGYYSSALVIYLVLMTCLAYGLPKAIKKILTTQISQGQYGLVYKTSQCILLFAFIAGGIISVVTFLGAEFIATHILNASLAIHAIRSISPCLLMITLVSAMHGIFNSIRATKISKIIHKLQALLVAAFTILSSLYFTTYSFSETTDAYSAMGGALGLTCAVTITCMIMFVIYCDKHKRLRNMSLKDNTKIHETHWQIIKNLLISMLPFMLTLLIFYISKLCDFSIFNRIMKVQGYKESEYIEYLGILSGKYEFFISIPLLAVNWYAASKITPLSNIIKRQNAKKTNRMIGNFLRYSMLFIMPVTLLLILYSDAFLHLCFTGDIEVASLLLKTGAITIVFYSLTAISNASLTALDEWYEVAKNAFKSLLIQIVGLLIMMIALEWEVIAVVFSRIIFSASFYIFNEHSLRERTGYVQDKKRIFSIPFTGTLIMGAVSFIIYFITNLFIKDKYAILICIPFAFISYVLSMVFLGGISQREMYLLPGGKYLAPLCKKLHLLH